MTAPSCPASRATPSTAARRAATRRTARGAASTATRSHARSRARRGSALPRCRASGTPRRDHRDTRRPRAADRCRRPRGSVRPARRWPRRCDSARSRRGRGIPRAASGHLLITASAGSAPCRRDGPTIAATDGFEHGASGTISFLTAHSARSIGTTPVPSPLSADDRARRLDAEHRAFTENWTPRVISATACGASRGFL